MQNVPPPPILSGQGRKVEVLQQQMDFGDMTSAQRNRLNDLVMELESLRDYLKAVAAA